MVIRGKSVEIMEVTKKVADEVKVCRYLQALGLLKKLYHLPFWLFRTGRLDKEMYL